MVRGTPYFLSGIVLVYLVVESPAFGAFGDFANQINTPLTPFAVTYVPSAQLLVVVQYIGGHAVRYEVSSPLEVGSMDPLFSPIGSARAPGIAWCETDKSLYWLQESDSPEGVVYKLLRTDLDGFALPEGPQLDVPPGTLLGDITYVPEQDAFWSVDIENDRYIAFDRQSGEQLGQGFFSPLRHPDSGVAYGLGLTYVPVGEGQLDLLVGKLTDLRALRVVRVDFAGTPVGVSYWLNFPADDVRPGWPAGIAYCRGQGGHFTAVADAGRDQIILVWIPVPALPGVTGLTGTATEQEITSPGEVESITATLSWTNTAPYDGVVVELWDPARQQFSPVASAGPGDTTLAHELNREGFFLYRVSGTSGGVTTPPALLNLRSGSGALVSKVRIGEEGVQAPAFGVALVEKNPLVLYVGELLRREAQQAIVVHRFEKQPSGELLRLSPIGAPFGEPEGVLLVGLTWDRNADELVWLGRDPDGSYRFARTDTEGNVTGEPQKLDNPPFGKAVVGDIAYDPSRDLIWATAREPNALWSFNGKTGLIVTENEPLPSSLPGEVGSWGLVSGLAIRSDGADTTPVFYVTLEKIPAVEAAPAAGSGYVSRLVALKNLGGGFLPVGHPVPIDAETDSALLRGVAVSPDGTAFLVGGDTGWLYELTVAGSGPLFARGDVEQNGTLDLADVMALLTYLFSGGAEPGCLDAADLNDNGTVNLSDALELLRHLFGLLGTTPLSPPFGVCGTDPTADSVSCLSPSLCQ